MARPTAPADRTARSPCVKPCLRCTERRGRAFAETPPGQLRGPSSGGSVSVRAFAARRSRW